MSNMKLYYPLGLRSKVEHPYFGFIPNKKFRKFKRELKSGNEIESIFKKMYRNLKNYTVNSFHTSCSRPDIRDVLEKIIPDTFFGSQNNKKKVFYIITRILTQTQGEFIHMCTLFQNYEYSDFCWIDPKQDIKQQVFFANLLLLQTVVKPLIRYFYYYTNKYRNRELLVVPNGQLRSFIDHNIDKFLKVGYIKKIRKETPKTVSLNGTLRFIPKKSLESLECRPLVLISRQNNIYPLGKLKENLKFLIKKYQIGSIDTLYEKWATFIEHSKSRRKLNAVKLDLTDAFGMVDLKVLKTIIEADEKFLTESQKNFLYRVMSKQYVHIQGSKQYYLWCHGVLQGTRLSPHLCELYLSYLVFEHLRHFHKPNTLLHRTIDDILFVSTCDTDIHEFTLAAMRVFLLNEDKNQTFVNIGEDHHIAYCGKVFNMKTREVANSYDFEKDTEMRIKFKFWNPRNEIAADKPYKFLLNCMKFSYVNYCFSKFELSTRFNTVDTVLKNIFVGMCYVAFKLDSAVESIGYVFNNLEDRCRIVNKIIHSLLAQYTPIIQKIIEKYKGEKYEDIFAGTLLWFIGRKAFIVVLKKRYAKYVSVIQHLKTKTKIRVKINNVQYFCKLPKHFENIKMRRGQKSL